MMATPPPDAPAACQVSLVVIGRNEEQFIECAIASALEAGAHVASSEVLYVDSASTDRTVERAKAFPIRILQLKPEWTLTPAAGRYTGFRHAAGEYVFFIDGDTEVEGPWLASAIEFLNTHHEYGAVAGVLNEVWVDRSGKCIGGRDNIFEQDLNAKVWDTKSLGGIAVYRRSTLEQVGNFNPFIPAGEEREVAIRIRLAGFKLARIEGVMGRTYADNRQSWREIVRRFNTSFYDYGLPIRYSALYGAGLQIVLEEIPYVVSFLLFGLFLIIATPLALALELTHILLGIVLLTLLALIVKKGVKGACLSICVRSISTYRTLLSLMRAKPLSVESYPTDVIQVQ
ncbi:glycosyltransferase family 2 protein [Candidatus Entotheonella palauensis]|uniref:glycosyltransferase family 2 protein n=1 Tax=Candidatus Entotheonella palauensis TaxID=93172 RepID=UPI000B7F0FD4|nr:glycosyltransferase family 2 protein [Candidatus Entotheonella palauensis]